MLMAKWLVIFFCIYFVTSSDPLKIIMSIVLSTILYSFILMEVTNIMWMPIIIVMILVGGLMVLYILVLSMSPNILMNSKYKSLMSMSFLISITFLLNMENVKTSFMTSNNFFDSSPLVMVVTLIVLIISMILITGLSLNPKAPSKSFK